MNLHRRILLTVLCSGVALAASLAQAQDAPSRTLQEPSKTAEATPIPSPEKLASKPSLKISARTPTQKPAPAESRRLVQCRLVILYFGCEEQDQLKRASYESDHSIDYSARSRRANRLEAISSVSRNRGQRRRLFVSCLSAGSRALSASSPHPSRGRDFANARGRSEPHPAADAFL